MLQQPVCRSQSSPRSRSDSAQVCSCLSQPEEGRKTECKSGSGPRGASAATSNCIVEKNLHAQRARTITKERNAVNQQYRSIDAPSQRYRKHLSRPSLVPSSTYNPKHSEPLPSAAESRGPSVWATGSSWLCRLKYFAAPRLPGVPRGSIPGFGD